METIEKLLDPIRVRVDADFDELFHISEQAYGEIINLPEPQDDTINIVSSLVLVALQTQGIKRTDIFAPRTSDANRDSEKRIISVKGLSSLSPSKHLETIEILSDEVAVAQACMLSQ